MWTIQLPYISHENREVQTSINKLIKNQTEEAWSRDLHFHPYYKPKWAQSRPSRRARSWRKFYPRWEVIQDVLAETAERLSSPLSHSGNTTTEGPRRFDSWMSWDTELAISGYLVPQNDLLPLHPRRYVVALSSRPRCLFL